MADYTFTCPECGEVFVVDAQVRSELILEGCLYCHAPVSPSAFSRGASTPTAR